jgi:hypothetical protein
VLVSSNGGGSRQSSNLLSCCSLLATGLWGRRGAVAKVQALWRRRCARTAERGERRLGAAHESQGDCCHCLSAARARPRGRGRAIEGGKAAPMLQYCSME